MNHSINLIPPATQRRYALRRVLRVGVTWLAASGACTAALLGVEWLRGVSTLRELMELEARYAPFVRIAEESEALRSKIAGLQSREEVALAIGHEESGLALLGLLSRAAADLDGTVYFDHLAYQVPSTENASSLSRRVQISGVGLDGVSVAGFATKLRESRVFKDVAVQNTQPYGGGAASLREFTVLGSL